MITRLTCIGLLLLVLFTSFGYADTLEGKTQQLTSPDQVPEGLAKSDWQSIRAAHEAGRHAFQPVGDGWQARNPGQQWLTQFEGQGFTVTPDAGGWTWGLELAGYGKPTGAWQEGGKISYARADGLTEWFINDTRGLEQGWTLTQRPVRAGPSGPVRLDLTVRGGLRPQISPEGASVAFLNESGGAALTYGGLKAWDADGKTVQARFVEGAGKSQLIGVVVDDTEAKYPITVDPIAQQAYLKASNAGAGDEFGWSVAVSGDTVVVGAPFEDSNATGVDGNQADNTAADAGAAYVFVRSGTTWSQQAYLKASNTEADDKFGWSVAVSGDTVVVGAPFERSSATGVNGNQVDNWLAISGAAYVFVRSGTTWSQQAYLKASNTDLWDGFGHSVSVSGDTVVIGAFGEASNATGVNGNQADNSTLGSGAAYVFVRNGTTWNQQAYLKASNTGTRDYFGLAVAVSGDTVVVGAYQEDSNSTGVNSTPNDTGDLDFNSGAAYVFVRSGTTWSQQAYLKASNTGTQDYFGYSVAISGDTVVVGAYQEDSNATGVNSNQADNTAADAGAVYVFARSGTTWSQQAYLKASNTDFEASNTDFRDGFGHSVAVSGDTVVVGAPFEDSNATGVNGNQADDTAADAGAVYVFVRSGTTWSQQAYLKASNTGAEDVFGRSVAASGDTVVIGANWEDSNSTGMNGNQDDNSAPGSGAAYVFADLVSFSLLTSAVNGTITGNGIYTSGGTATLTAIGAPGYGFTGWTGDASGTANPLSLLMNSDKTVGANFTRQFTLTTTTLNNGSITGIAADGKYFTETTATLTAIPAANYVFTGWTGDASGTANPLSIPMDSDKTIGATFGPDPSDADGDGLPAYLELAVYATNPNSADTDGDGLTDAWEVGVGRFSIIQGSFTWEQARTDAKAKGGDLASLPDENRWNRVMETLGANALDPYAGLWIGAGDVAVEGNWTWVNGEAFVYQRWAATRPSTITGNTLDYAEVAGGAGAEIGKWYDRASITTRDGYILETGFASNPTDADSDDDGLSDGQERTLGTNPLRLDTDGDGLGDSFEVKFQLNPVKQDSDGDGIADGVEDEDGDTLTNSQEAALGTSPHSGDSDADGLLDQEEVNVHSTDPTKKDTDGDLLKDGTEVKVTSTNPLVKDTDEDGVQDGDEDLDGDGFTNRQELELFLTAPNNGSDRFAIEFEYTPSAHALKFPTVSGRRYRVERSLDLINPAGWAETVTFIGSGATVTVPLGAPFSSIWFYRVRVSLD